MHGDAGKSLILSPIRGGEGPDYYDFTDPATVVPQWSARRSSTLSSLAGRIWTIDEQPLAAGKGQVLHAMPQVAGFLARLNVRPKGRLIVGQYADLSSLYGPGELFGVALYDKRLAIVYAGSHRDEPPERRCP